MRCPQCGHLNPEGAEECEACGVNLAWAAENVKEPCPACGTMNPALSTKCSNCGFNLERHREQQKREEEEQKRREQAMMRADEEKEQARKNANNALFGAIFGIFCFGIILEPLAIWRARKAKEVLRPGDPGYGSAQAAEIIGWIFLVLWILAVAVQVCNYLSNGY
jgi:ribosomal protein L40E